MLNEKKIFALKKGIWCVYIACEDVCLNVIAGERLKVNSLTSVFVFFLICDKEIEFYMIRMVI